MLKFKTLSNIQVKRLLFEVYQYSDLNLRFNPEKFIEQDFKYRKDLFPERIWYGCFDTGDGRCKSLSLLEKDKNGIILMAEVQSFVKGFGVPLIRNIISRAENIWFAVDPNSGDDLVEYYRQFGLEEYQIAHSIWADGNKQYFFAKVSSEINRNRILATLNKANCEN